MNSSIEQLTRRQALTRAAYLLGGALSAPTIAGVLAGCAAPDETARLLGTLSPAQAELVLALGEVILPETDTPGARAARVDRFIDAMLTDFYSEEPRRRFLAGLERVDARARRELGAPFVELAPDSRLRLVEALNRAAYADAPGEGWPPEDVGRQAWFRTLKELVLVGYYTSEPGATQELRPNPMGVWRADVAYSDLGQAWA